LEKELHTLPEILTDTYEVAEAIAERARELAPVDTGRYRDGIYAQKPSPKGVARVLASDQKSSWVEFGNGHQPAQYVMRTAVESLGLEFKKGK
jgi:hypothetical protein